MKTIFLIVILLMAALALYSWFVIWPKIGKNPEGEYLRSLEISPQFDSIKKKFLNTNESIVTRARENANSWKIMWSFFFPKNKVTPDLLLPEEKPNFAEFLKNRSTLKFIWLGHSTFIVNLQGSILLFDPVFSKSASPVDFLTPRFQKPTVELKDLPAIDYIIISHDHYDHLDSETIIHFKNKQAKFLVPLGLKAHLKSWGIEESRITELDWWKNFKIENIEFICTPAQHFSGRLIPYENKTLWASWVIRTKTHSIYYSGDSGYGSHFKEIGKKYGPFDISFIENGQYDEQWRPIHVHPEEVSQAYFDLKSKALVPVHWGMFNMALHHWFDPIEKLDKIAHEENINLLTPKLGQVVDMDALPKFEKWWRLL